MKGRLNPIAQTSNAMRDVLWRLPPTTVSRIKSQARVAVEENPLAQFATVGVWLQGGVRQESRHQQGITKVLLNSALKGTTTQDAAAIRRTVDELGGNLVIDVQRENASVAMHGVPKAKTAEAAAFVCDLVRNARLTDEDITATKKEALAQRWEQEENIDAQTMDALHIAAYDATENGGLGNSIFGSEEGIESLSPADLRAYRSKNITGPTTMLVGVGAVDHVQMERLASQHLGDLSTENNKLRIETRYVGGDHRMWQTRMKTAHCAFATETCGRVSGDSVALQLLTHVQGSFHRSQHELGVAAVHRALKQFGGMDHGVSHLNVLPHEGPEVLNAFCNIYEDTGLFGVYVVGRAMKSGYGYNMAFYDMLEVQIKEYTRMCAKACHQQEIDQAKVKFKSQLLFNQDGGRLTAHDIAEQVFLLGRRVPISEMYARIDDIDQNNLYEVGNHYYAGRPPVFAFNGNFYPVPGYEYISRHTSHVLSNN